MHSSIDWSWSIGDCAAFTRVAVQVLEGLKLTPDQFVDLCILCGCDYLDTIKGVPPEERVRHSGVAGLQVHALMLRRWGQALAACGR